MRGRQALAGGDTSTPPSKSALCTLTASMCKTLNEAGTISLIGLLIKPEAKSTHPQDTSPSGKEVDEQDEEIPIVDMTTAADAGSQAKNDPSTSLDSEREEDSLGEGDSLNKEIANTRRSHFHTTKTPDDLTVTTTASRPWVQMSKMGQGMDQGEEPPDTGKKKVAKFDLIQTLRRSQPCHEGGM
jgi:hypothetical protein